MVHSRERMKGPRKPQYGGEASFFWPEWDKRAAQIQGMGGEIIHLMGEVTKSHGKGQRFMESGRIETFYQSIYYKEAFFSFLKFFYLFVCPSVRCCMRGPVSWSGIKPGPLRGESGVLATGPLGKSPRGSILSHLFYKQHSVFKCSFPILLTYGVQGILRKPEMEYWYERF